MGPLSSLSLEQATVVNGSQTQPQNKAQNIPEQLAALSLSSANGLANGRSDELLLDTGVSMNGSDSSAGDAHPEDGEAEPPAVYPVPSDPVQGFGIDSRDANTPDR